MNGTDRSVFVAGGCGFIGGHFVRQLACQAECQIVVVDKLTYASDFESIRSLVDMGRVQFLQADICDLETIYGILSQHRCDWVVNFAAESHVDRSIDGPDVFVQSNTVGAQRLAEAAYRYWTGLEDSSLRNHFRFLQVSTDEVYGSCDAGLPFREGQAYNPSSPYAASKAAGDHLVMSYHKTYGLPVLTSIASNNFGPFQFPEKLIPLMIQRSMNGGVLPIYGEGNQRRDWLFVEDHCDALLSILKAGKPGETYHVASNVSLTNLQLVERICKILEMCAGISDAKNRIQSVADRPGHDYCYSVDASKLRKELGWQASASFDDHLQRTVRWYLENLDWLNRKSQTANAADRLGTRGTKSYYSAGGR